jgi:hypothetical protein
MLRGSALALCALLVLSSGPARADGEADPAAFERSIASIRRQLQDGKGEKGLEALARVLKEHEGQPYVRGHRAELEDLARRLAFCRHCESPDPKGLVSGKLMKWNGATGQIKIRYTPKTAQDLVGRKLLMHPARFTGPVTIEVKGTCYPSTTKASAQIVFGGDESPAGEPQNWYVLFGTPPYTEGQLEKWLPAQMIIYDGEERAVLDEKEITPAKPGRSYKLKVVVGKTRIMAKIDNRTILKGRKPKDIWGTLAFEAPTWTQATISGDIEPAWIQSKIDEAVQQQSREFDKTYDRADLLPAWLFTAPETGPDASESEAPTLPEPVPGEHADLERSTIAALVAEKYDEGLRLVGKMKEVGVPASTCAYLEGRFLLEARRNGEALAALDRLVGLAPEFARGHLSRGIALRRLGRLDDALGAFEKAIELGPRLTSVYEMATSGMLFGGRPAQAQHIARRAAVAGVKSEYLESLNKALIKATQGPRWNRTFEHKSRNYHVLSDIDKDTCLEASKLLEEAFTSYRVNFGWVSRDESRLFKVYLFGGRQGFQQYQVDISMLMGKPSEKAAGLYSPLLKQLLIWNLPNRDDMMETIRHEGFHQYMDRFLPDPPVWFDEGLAVYHENPEKVSGRLKFGQLHRYYLEALETDGLVPLRDFMRIAHGQFYENSPGSYGQAWLFVHMLQHGSTQQRGLFKQFVEELQSSGASTAIDKVFPADRQAELDKDLETYRVQLTAAK